MAYMELHGLPTEETRDALLVAMQKELDVSKADADELLILGRWLMNECNGPAPAIGRASRRLFRLTEGDIGPLLEILKSASADPLSDQQREALDEIRRAFRIK